MHPCSTFRRDYQAGWAAHLSMLIDLDVVYTHTICMIVHRVSNGYGPSRTILSPCTVTVGLLFRNPKMLFLTRVYALCMEAVHLARERGSCVPNITRHADAGTWSFVGVTRPAVVITNLCIHTLLVQTSWPEIKKKRKTVVTTLLLQQ